MKYFYVLISTLLSFGIFGQDPVTVSHTNQWNTIIFNPFSPQITTSKYTFSEETTFIDGKEYKELLITSIEDGVFKGYGDYYRESGGQVYRYDLSGEKLVYDFNLQVGDTFHHPDDDYDIVLFVYKVETVTFSDSISRRKITLNCSYDFSHPMDMIWIEGIGVTTGIGSEPWYCIFDIGSELTCFFHNGVLVYQDERIGTCWKITTHTFEKERSLFHVFPNPVKDYLHIEQLITHFDYEIKSMDGKTVQRGESNQRIYVENLPKGIYLLKIIADSTTGIVKFVKE